MRRGVLFACAVALAWPLAASAEVVRYALVFGNNLGRADEETLRYAEEDARRIHETLAELGGFLPENTLLLRGADAERVRAALIRMNERIRTGGASAMLVVFYSGHADATALHLGDTALPLDQLEQLVRGSPAALRLLVVDACRSGALTRVKGGTPVPVPELELDQRLPSDGVAFWSSSSANEDAQESDDIRGSFFTHYLVSGLLGAADEDRDGRVTLGEAYRYAYETTLRATSKTLAGTQHPTFHHEIHGMVDVTLTSIVVGGRSLMTFPRGRDYLVMADGPDGPVVAEVGARDVERRVSLRPGRYFVRGRARDHLLEGTIAVRAGQPGVLDDGGLERVEYARLVRKGGARASAESIEAGYTVRSPLWSGASPCQGVVVGWGIDLPVLSVSVRGRACRGGFSNAYLEATNDEFGAEVRVVHAWDAHPFTVAGGALAGATLVSQRFDAPGMAPTRVSPLAEIGLASVLTLDVADGVYFAAEVDGLTTFFVQENVGETAGKSAFSLRGNLVVGKRF
jgi:hypothetical protein